MTLLQTQLSLFDGNAEGCLRFEESFAVVNISLRSMCVTWTTSTICNYDEDTVQRRRLMGTSLIRPFTALASAWHLNSKTSACGHDARNAFTTVPATFAFISGKERDTESGNDYFGARYYASTMGRFMSPDPAGVRAIKPASPQTWNWYAYTLNNPLRYTDPTGKYTCADDGNKCQSQNDKNFEAARQRDLGSKDKGVAAAAAAYGDPTKDNHVGVQFTDNKDSRTDLSVSFNGKSVTSQITSTISTSGNLDNTVGHEGTHVEQEQALGASFKPDGSFNGKLNLTIYDAENGAFHTEATIMQLSGKTQQLGNDFRFPINPTDSPAQVDRMINQYLALPEDQGGNYSVTPQNPGGTLVQPK